jgi:anti-sigma regulatory factor (Ser/Thr protein kinase)
MRVPFCAASVPVVRSRLRSWLAEANTPGETAYDARVVITELVANAVRHAKPLADGTLEVAWHLHCRGLEMAVTDGGAPTRPRRVTAPAFAVDGRGMSIVEALANRWWTEQGRARSTVHALLSTKN